MTIKEVEQLLEIPRATVRFYEKEGLIEPGRAGNGYRDYSDEDIEKLRKIIVLRRIGINVSDISDLFDGVKSMQQILDDNVMNLQKQLEELNGALNLTRKMKTDMVELDAFDAAVYMDIIEEEEKKGNTFMSIAKDLVETEKKVILGHFAWTDVNGKPYAKLPEIIRNVLLCTAAVGCISCFIEKQWSVSSFISGIKLLAGIIAVDVIASVPVYFLGRKWPWFKKHRELAIEAILCITLLVILLFLGSH